MPIVSAVGTAVAHGGTGEEGDRLKRIEAAMAAAVAKAQAEGVTDQDVIRERILAARGAAR